MKLVTVSEMQAIEREADSQGWTYQQMMEKAGNGLAEIVEAFYGYEEERSVVALVGSGNNGGDTLIALEQLALGGWTARAYLVRPREQNDPLVNRLKQAGGELLSASAEKNYNRLADWIAKAAVLLDGVLGTGIRLPLKPEVGALLEYVKTLQNLPEVVAVDCPSGVDLDSGEAAEQAIPADLTVCMAAVKTGLLKFPAFELAGHIEVVDIGLPEGLPSWDKVRRETVSEEFVRAILPPRPANSHKGTYGTASVVGGSLNFTGAVLLAAKAAYRIGAGLVQVAVPTPLHTALAGHLPEAVWVLLPHELGAISESAVDVLARHLDKSDVLLLGPGFGLEETSQAFIRRLVESKALKSRGSLGFVSALPAGDSGKSVSLPSMVIDADGLKLLARIDGWAQKLPAMCVLTPHPGEMAILTGEDVREVQSDRLEVARRYAQEWGHVVVLKGAMTVIAEPGGDIRVVPVATSALAHAGTGDVLAGLIAGLRAQGIAPFEAAVAGAWIHAQCGLLAAEQIGHEASVLAGDLVDVLPEVLAWVW